MAQKKLAAPPREVAQIVIYLAGNPAPLMVRYTDMPTAKKQFDILAKAMQTVPSKVKPVVLAASAATVLVKYPPDIQVAYLVDIEISNVLLVDTQKRVNAMMQS